MASATASKRLRKELRDMRREPVDGIRAMPQEDNILEWHYVLEGQRGTPYEGGFYHGRLRFPPLYPFKPPSVLMYTPNGRFKTGTRLCLSMSDFHPETWNPMWSVSTILKGLASFMVDTAGTVGSIDTSAAQKRRFARESLAFNLRDERFCELFPELVELAAAASSSAGADDGGAAGAGAEAAAGAGAGAAGAGAGAGAATAPVATTAAGAGAAKEDRNRVLVLGIVLLGTAMLLSAVLLR